MVGFAEVRTSQIGKKYIDSYYCRIEACNPSDVLFQLALVQSSRRTDLHALFSTLQNEPSRANICLRDFSVLLLVFLHRCEQHHHLLCSIFTKLSEEQVRDNVLERERDRVENDEK